MRRKKRAYGSRIGSPHQPHADQLELDLGPPVERRSTDAQAERSNRSHTYYAPRRIAGLIATFAACRVERRRSTRPATLDAGRVRAMMRDPPSASAVANQ